MKIIVTGGAGFLGSHVVDRLLALGHEVAIIDNLWQTAQKRYVPEGVQLVKEDVASEAARNFVLDFQPDAVYHLAAQISVPVSVENPVADAHTNVLGTVNIMQAAHDAGVKRFIYTSTCGVYGDSPDLPLKEESELRPKSPYALSKKVGEEYARYMSVERGVNILSIRPANLYGPRQQKVGEAGVIAIFLDNILHGKSLTVTGDGTATRDWLYVEDAADAFVQALTGEAQGIVNIGTGIEQKVQDLVDILRALHGGGEVVYGAPRPGDIYRSYLNVVRAKEMLGWESTTSFEEGLKKTYNWFKEEV